MDFLTISNMSANWTNITLSKEYLLLAVPDSKTCEVLDIFILLLPLVMLADTKIPLMGSGEWKMLASWEIPIDSNSSFTTVGCLTDCLFMLSIAICSERQLDSCSVAASCEFSVLYIFWTDCPFLWKKLI